ncbi:alpha/beta hydrolase [bacterium]|nr:alpha/beta hydrolase [bacterium]
MIENRKNIQSGWLTVRKNRLFLIIGSALLILLFIWLVKPVPRGIDRFYADQPYHFNTLRAFGHIPSGGGDTAEILGTIQKIKQGEEESWFTEWEKTGARVEWMGRSLTNPTSRGLALLRAHNYYRTAEFFLDPDDTRRSKVFRKNQEVFYEGLNTLKVDYKIIKVPYGEHQLKAIYFPAKGDDGKKPLIVACGGYDSTLEELYFVIVKPALDRGYSTLIYEGPGQGSIIREQNLIFTHEWEKPTGAVLDEFYNQYSQKRKIVLIGMSMGGYLAPSAAAFDNRIDGVVAFDQFHDYQEIAFHVAPGIVKHLYNLDFLDAINLLLKLKMKTTPNLRWGIRNAQWTMGVREPITIFDVFSKYTLKTVSANIKSDVLILAGEKDHFMPLSHAVDFKNALTNAHSVELRVFTEEEGGHEHCQLGASHLWQGVFFDWVEKRFPG